jgi:hypothetical protein
MGHDGICRLGLMPLVSCPRQCGFGEMRLNGSINVTCPRSADPGNRFIIVVGLFAVRSGFGRSTEMDVGI